MKNGFISLTMQMLYRELELFTEIFNPWLNAALFLVSLIHVLRRDTLNFGLVYFPSVPHKASSFKMATITSSITLSYLCVILSEVSISRYLLLLPQAGLAPSLVPLYHISRCVMVCLILRYWTPFKFLAL
jgi:hypothetical protein